MPIYTNHNIIINSLTEKIYNDYDYCIKNNINTEEMGYLILDNEKKMEKKHNFIKSKHLHLGNGL